MGLILKGLSHEMDLAFDDMYVYWALIGEGPVLKFFCCSIDFKTQKVYFLRLLKVYISLIMSAACTYSRFSCQHGLGHFLKVPKLENFSLEFFALSEPIWVCESNRIFYRLTPDFDGFWFFAAY